MQIGRNDQRWVWNIRVISVDSNRSSTKNPNDIYDKVIFSFKHKQNSEVDIIWGIP